MRLNNTHLLLNRLISSRIGEVILAPSSHETTRTDECGGGETPRCDCWNLAQVHRRRQTEDRNVIFQVIRRVGRMNEDPSHDLLLRLNGFVGVGCIPFTEADTQLGSVPGNDIYELLVKSDCAFTRQSKIFLQIRRHFMRSSENM